MNNIIYVQDIINVLNIYINERYAANWDNVGLIIGNKNQIITKILCCLDITKDVIKEAILLKANLIISHHPILFNKIKKIIYNNSIDNINIITDIIKNNISIICMHTNADYSFNGTNNLLCKKLKLKRILDIRDKKNDIFYKIGQLNNKLLFETFLKFLKIKLNIMHLRFVKSKNNVMNIAICSGSGGSNLNHIYLYNKNIDTFITSDIKYDVMLLSYNMNINIIDAGHFETEIFIVNYFKTILKKNFKELEIIIFNKNYIEYI